MESCSLDTIPLFLAEDVLLVRQAVRAAAARMGFDAVCQARFVTAASEISRNVVMHASSGRARVECIEERSRRGLRLVVEDDGPGIPDVELAMADGFTTGAGLGSGLGGARRLVDEFDLVSVAGKGTTVSVTMWL